MNKHGVGVLVASLLAGGAADAAVKMVHAPRSNATRQVATQVADGEIGRWRGTRAIVMDRATGKLRTPTVTEAASLVRNLKQLTYRGVGTAQAAGNGEKAAVEGGYVIVARPTADGGSETFCASSFEEAAAFLGLQAE